ncbi:MAG: hypothetical protein H7315_07560 [Herminiimonas sp.]|nr:hypothetical protein [Herminiimonas sp.]
MSEIRWRQIRGASELLQDAVDATVTATETVHQAIARKPYAILASFDAIAAPVRQVEQVQATITAGVYSAIRAVNKGVGTVATRVIDHLDQSTD